MKLDAGLHVVRAKNVLQIRYADHRLILCSGKPASTLVNDFASLAACAADPTGVIHCVVCGLVAGMRHMDGHVSAALRRELSLHVAA